MSMADNDLTCFARSDHKGFNPQISVSGISGMGGAWGWGGNKMGAERQWEGVGCFSVIFKSGQVGYMLLWLQVSLSGLTEKDKYCVLILVLYSF